MFNNSFGFGGAPVAREGIERRLTTIMSADVVGYSRLMAGDEAGTFAHKGRGNG